MRLPHLRTNYGSVSRFFRLYIAEDKMEQAIARLALTNDKGVTVITVTPLS